MVKLGTDGWKERYYAQKLEGVEPADVARAYLVGLAWVLKYYYTVSRYILE